LYRTDFQFGQKLTIGERYMTNNEKLDTVSETSTREEWQTPEIVRMNAEDAELAPGGSPDGGIGS
jgi:hypothetical protein